MRIKLQDQERPGAFGRRKVVPRVGLLEAKAHLRAALTESLEDLGFVVHPAGSMQELVALLHDAAPDLVVLRLPSAATDDTVDLLTRLAAELYDGNVLLVGAAQSPALGAMLGLGRELGLAMLPPLQTPYREPDLRERVTTLIPHGPVPSPPIDVAQALHAGWLELWYQAKIDPHRLIMAGAEALIRMRHPTWGIVAPAYFIPDDGDPHFRLLSDFVARRAMEDWRYFVGQAGAVELAINLPMSILEDPGSVDALRRQLPDHPAFTGLIVEINGTEVIRDVPLAKRVARELRLSNIGISIDDLGAEWSALADIDDFPFVEIKVDRKFVTGCAEDRLKRALCRTIVDLADRFGARSVAEGVETRADFLAARYLGFDLVQGFLFGRPMPRRKFARKALSQPVAAPAEDREP
jgi:EAL domain-containing protein (putative c-di-GMP-specific phosphodiesterase class I)/CheY-like chemotaxis protein